jgi:hypothetical protein
MQHSGGPHKQDLCPRLGTLTYFMFAFTVTCARAALPRATTALVPAPCFARLLSAAAAKVTVTTDMIKELRASTGAPMMECKAALSDPAVNGDLQVCGGLAALVPAPGPSHTAAPLRCVSLCIALHVRRGRGAQHGQVGPGAVL